MALKKDLTELISNPDSGIQSPEFDLEETPNGKVGGFVISTSFADMSQIERQNLLWDYIDNHLNNDQILHIISLVTVTPEENKDN